MGFLESLLSNINLPPEKKKVLSIGGIAFIVLLFVSFLLSLLEDDKEADVNNANMNAPVAVVDNNNMQQSVQGSLQLPSSQRFDFDQDQNTNGQGLESLLSAQNPNQQQQQEIGLNNNPFANMQPANEALGPAPIPTEEEEANNNNNVAQTLPAQPQEAPKTEPKAYLYCGDFANSAEAESQKAMLAFQGYSSQVVTDKGKYRLRLGPYNTTDQARQIFNDLGNRELVTRCSLLTK